MAPGVVLALAVALGGPLVSLAWAWRRDLLGRAHFAEAFVVTTAALLVAAVVVAYRPQRFSLRLLSLPLIFFLTYPVLIVLPTPYIAVRYTEPYVTRYVWSVALSFVATVVGVALVPRTRRPPATGLAPPRFRRPADDAVVAVLVLVAASISALWVLLLPSVPLLDLVGGSSSALALAQARQQSLVSFGLAPVRAAVDLLRLLVLPFLSAYALVRYLQSRTRMWLAVFAAVFGLAVMLSVLTIQRAVIGTLLLTCAFAWLRSADVRLRARHVAAAAAAFLAFPLAVSFLLSGRSGGASSFVTAVTAIGRRLLYLPSDVLAKYFVFVPDTSEGFFHGGTLPVLGRLVFGARVPIDTLVYQQYLSRTSGFEDGKANAAYVGALWADFGWLGVTAGALVVGILLGLVDRAMARRRTTAGQHALYGVLAMRTILLAAAPAFTSVLSFGPGVLELAVLALLLDAVGPGQRRRRSGLAHPSPPQPPPLEPVPR